MEALQSTLTALSAQLSLIEKHLSALESGKPASVAHVATVAAVPTPPTHKKGKAKAAPSPPKPQAKERSTKKSPTAPSDFPLHLAQTFPQEGKPDRHLMTVAIPLASAAHCKETLRLTSHRFCTSDPLPIHFRPTDCIRGLLNSHFNYYFIVRF